MSNLDSLIELFIDGRYGVGDLEAFLDILSNIRLKYRRFSEVIRDKIYRLYNSEKFTYRLLELALTHNELYRVLVKYKKTTLQLSLLRKAYAITGLVNNEYTISCSDLLQVLVKPHKLISLYNPLIITYINKYCSREYLSLINALKKKTPVYEANPSYLNTILFRDFYIYSILLYDKISIHKLYMDLGEYVEKIIGNNSIDLNELVLIINSYNRVLSSVIQLIRLSSKMLDEYKEIDNEFSIKGYETRYVREVVEWYLKSILRLLNTILTTSINTFISLTGVSKENISDTILSAYKTYTSSNEIVEKTGYTILKLLLEISLYNEYSYYVEKHDLELGVLINDFINTLKTVIIDSIKHSSEAYKRILLLEGEPYDTLRKRLLERRDLGDIHWLMEK